MAKRKLTPKQRLFVAEYLKDLNATQAAVRAGYSQKTAYRIGAQLLQKTSVSEAVQKAMTARGKRTEITADRVLEQYGRMAFFDLRTLFGPDGQLKPITEWPDEAAAAVAGFEIVELTGDIPGVIKKAKLVDKRAALADIAKHLGMFTERVEVSGAESLIEAIMQGRKRAGQ
ncbi:terminase small subunit [Desulfovibrio sp. OttesenSCG-928-A18]|nr:terminase small subunit [Desulfovibrio sp. OttesenSCG-928-A18]